MRKSEKRSWEGKKVRKWEGRQLEGWRLGSSKAGRIERFFFDFNFYIMSIEKLQAVQQFKLPDFPTIGHGLLPSSLLASQPPGRLLAA